MQQQLDDVWQRAAAYYSAQLSDRERRRMVQIRTQEELLKRLHAVAAERTGQRINVVLRKVYPFIAQLRSLTQIINIFVQSSQIASLVWGPLALIIELAARHRDSLDLVTDFFQRVEQVFPRFQEYLKEFGPRRTSPRFKDALVEYYKETIGHYQDSIKFLCVNPVVTSESRLVFPRRERPSAVPLFARLHGLCKSHSDSSVTVSILFASRSANKFHLNASKRLVRLQDRTRQIEDEVQWIQYQTQQLQHAQVVSLLRQSPVNVMALALPYRDLPCPRNTSFRYRSALLSSLEGHLRPNVSATSLSTCSLYGLGGVGKTQTALEFAYRHANAYDAVFWVKAGSDVKVRDSLRTYALEMQGTQQAAPQQDAVLVRLFRQWLMTATVPDGSATRPARWLLVFDNVDQIGTIEPYWPAGCNGAVLVTSRDPVIARHFGARVYEVPLFTGEESVQYMLAINSDASAGSDTEVAAVKEISERLGHLPLVLSNMGAYAGSTASSYEAFLTNYSDFDRNLVFQDRHTPLFYERSISETWTLTLATLDPAARTLMEFLVLFDHDGAPLVLFEESDEDEKMHNGPSDEFPSLDDCLKGAFSDRQALDHAISTLYRGSLVSRVQDTLTCHRIVREAVIKSLAHDRVPLLFDRALFALNARFPKTLGGAPLLAEWQSCALYHTHLTSVIDLYHRFASLLRPPILLCEVIRRCTWYLCELGNFTEARNMLQQGCQILEDAAIRSDHPGYYPQYICRLTADLYNTFGSIEYELNATGHGRIWFEKADMHRRKLLDDDLAERFDLQTMAIVDANIALSVLADGASAQSCITAYNLLISTFDDKVSRSIWAANLSLAYRCHGDMAAASTWSQTAVEWTEEAIGRGGLSMAIVLHNLGNLHAAMHEDGKAFDAFDASLRIRQAKAPGHRYTAFSYHKMGLLMQARADLPSAATMLESAIDNLANAEGQLGATARSKAALANVLRDMGDFDRVAQLTKEVQDHIRALGDVVPSDDKLQEHLERYVLFAHR